MRITTFMGEISRDQILVVDDGNIVQQGKYDELIRQKGIYADFVLGCKEAIGWKM